MRIHKEPDQSILDQMYLQMIRLKYLYQISRIIIIVSIIGLMMIMVGGYSTFISEINTYGGMEFKQITNKNISENSVNSTKNVFIPKNHDTSQLSELVTLLYSDYTQTLVYISLIILLLMALSYTIFKTSINKRKLQDIEREYIHRVYNMAFSQIDANIGHEELFTKIFMNFPEVKEKMSKTNGQFSKTVNDYDDGYVMDLITDTKEGKIIGKYFQKSVELKDIEELMKNSLKYPKISRIVCISNTYNLNLDNSESEDKLLHLTKKIKLDLILQKDSGYYIIWMR